MAEKSGAKASSFLTIGPFLAIGLLLLIVGTLAPAFLATGSPPHTPQPLPPLWVEGWVNTDAPPADESLKGKVVVLDFWATWCGPCVTSLPKLARLNEQLSDREDFVLIGITGDSYRESPMRLAAFEQFIERIDGYDWPTAYGAEAVLSAADVQGYPTYILYGRDGRSVWKGHSVKQLETEIEKLFDTPQKVATL